MSVGAEHQHHQTAAAHGAIDPVCGMTVDPHTTPHRADYRGHPYYFCAAGVTIVAARGMVMMFDRAHDRLLRHIPWGGI